MQTVLLHLTGDVPGGYRCELKRAEAGAWQVLAAHDVPADLGAAEASQLLELIDGGPVGERIRKHVATHPQSDAFGAIGEHLASLLLRDETRQRWEELRGAAPEGLRTLLQIEPAELRLLPWELMVLQKTLFIDRRNPVLRTRRLGADPTQLLVPLRLLVVEGQWDPAIGTDVEVRAIKRALAEAGGRIEAEFLRQPSEQSLRRTYERFRPHVFHFLGHGTHVAGTTEPGLRVQDADGPVWVLTCGHFREILSPAPRVAVLNACRSGEVADVRDLTDALFDGGAVAVIGMQGDIKGDAAATFGGELYKALAGEEPVDAAVARARREVFAKVGNVQKNRDWFLPSLTTRVPPEQVLPLACPLPVGERQVVNLRFASLIEGFVDRVEERHRLVEGIDPEPGTDPVRLIVLAGTSDTGKTQILHWIRRRCALRGRRVKYVDFRGDAAADFLPALCTIRDTPEDVPSLGAHAAGAFARFNYDLGFLAAGKLPVEPEGALPVVDPAPTAGALPDGAVGLIDRTFQSFRDALGAATAEQPLVLILDHLDGLLRPGFQNALYPQLIRKIVLSGDAPDLRLVIALSDTDRRDLWPAEDARLGRWIDVDWIQPGQYPALAEDLLLALGIEIGEDHENLIKAMARFVISPWRPDELARIRHSVQRGR